MFSATYKPKLKIHLKFQSRELHQKRMHNRISVYAKDQPCKSSRPPKHVVSARVAAIFGSSPPLASGQRRQIRSTHFETVMEVALSDITAEASGCQKSINGTRGNLVLAMIWRPTNSFCASAFCGTYVFCGVGTIVVA